MPNIDVHARWNELPPTSEWSLNWRNGTIQGQEGHLWTCAQAIIHAINWANNDNCGYYVVNLEGIGFGIWKHGQSERRPDNCPYHILPDESHERDTDSNERPQLSVWDGLVVMVNGGGWTEVGARQQAGGLAELLCTPIATYARPAGNYGIVAVWRGHEFMNPPLPGFKLDDIIGLDRSGLDETQRDNLAVKRRAAHTRANMQPPRRCIVIRRKPDMITESDPCLFGWVQGDLEGARPYGEPVEVHEPQPEPAAETNVVPTSTDGESDDTPEARALRRMREDAQRAANACQQAVVVIQHEDGSYGWRQHDVVLDGVTIDLEMIMPDNIRMHSDAATQVAGVRPNDNERRGTTTDPEPWFLIDRLRQIYGFPEFCQVEHPTESAGIIAGAVGSPWGLQTATVRAQEASIHSQRLVEVYELPGHHYGYLAIERPGESEWSSNDNRFRRVSSVMPDARVATAARVGPTMATPWDSFWHAFIPEWSKAIMNGEYDSDAWQSMYDYVRQLEADLGYERNTGDGGPNDG